MITLKISGNVTIKKAAHVPVFRNWRLVMERREFGTQTVEIKEAVDLGQKLDLPRGGVSVKLKGFELRLNNVVGAGMAGKYSVGLFWNDFLVPGTYQVFDRPTATKAFRLNGSVPGLKGVKADLTAYIVI